jgi:hypothetical protein
VRKRERVKALTVSTGSSVNPGEPARPGRRIVE